MSAAAAAFDLSELASLISGKLGRHDVACPRCGPGCRSPVNRRRRVLRVWYNDPNFATYCCQRCGAEGYVFDRDVEHAYPAVLAKARAEAAERHQADVVESRRKARWLWSQRQPIVGSIAETYLRKCRGYTGPLPGTLGFLPIQNGHEPAMIAAFGTAVEHLPGEIMIYDAAVHGVHLTKLRTDGFGKAGTEADKLTVGMANTSPIWLAPVNDLGGLAIAEGIEDAFSVHQATGLGAWAAGTAGRLPAIADHVPSYVESVTIMVDADPVGETSANELAKKLDVKDIEVRLVRPERRA